MDDNTPVHDGTHIQPVPPPLEFPFPRTKTELPTSTEPTCQHSDASPVDIPNQDGHSYKPSYTKVDAFQRPSIIDKKHPTAGPMPPSMAKKSTASDPLAEELPSLRNGQQVSPKELGRVTRPTQTRTYTSWRPRRQKTSGAQMHKSTSSRSETSDTYGNFSAGNDDFVTKGKVDRTSGRLDISVNETSNRGYLANALGASLHHHQAPHPRRQYSEQLLELESTVSPQTGLRRPDLASKVSTSLGVPTIDDFSTTPVLNIVIMVIGSRGDIQPFLKLGKLLKENYKHRVRIATHPAFKSFVEKDSGLEFFSVGGDPSELMAFMVKNPGLIPSISTVRAGEIGRRRDSMFEMFQGFWRACCNATDDETDAANRKMMEATNPFVADAIIANPPCFAHVHCAERLGIPLHLMFTFPYSPTQQFPHPLANIKSSNVDTNYTNFMSYPLVEMMTWQGLGDLVNRFRVNTLGLEPVSTLWAPGQLFRLKVPYTYLWSPGLIPKPADWGPEIDIAGFVFLDLASSFEPPESLRKFLEDGEPPVYVGFGSIVVDDPDKFTNLIFEAVERAGVRALVSKGWGGLGGEDNVPHNIYMLENTPHDWLFPRVSAVVHHGGAGTTAIGLKCGKPTMIVPFFGDQPFWGAMVSRAGAGAHAAIPYKDLSIDALAEGIKQCLAPEAKNNAEMIARSIADEGDGAKNAVESFHKHLPLRGESSMRCTVFPDRVAVWILKNTSLRLSALAAQLFVNKRKFKWQDLRLIRHYDWSDFEGPGEPLTGAGAALAKTATGIAKGMGGLPVRWAKSFKRHEKREKQSEETTKSSAASESGESEIDSPVSRKSRSNDNLSFKLKGENGEFSQDKASQGRHHGLEQHLPEANTQGNLTKSPTANQDSVKEDIVGPIPSEPLGSETDNVSTAGSEDNIVEDLAEDTRAGFVKSGQAIAKAPMDLSLAIAQGFHNAPRLYGDETVRTPIRITGFHSGLRAAGEEFTFGIYDGVTGLVLQPYHGAKENGPIGFVQGLGKGIGGFVLKDLAAILGPVGYTLKGLHKEMIKKKQPTAFVRRSRMVQGKKDVKALDEEQVKEDEQKIDTAWIVLQEIHKEEDRMRSKGIMGKIQLKRVQKSLDSQGAFESVGRARKVLQDREMSRFIEEDKKINAEADERTKETIAKGGKEHFKKKRLVKFRKSAGGRDWERTRNKSMLPVNGANDEGTSNDYTTDTNASTTDDRSRAPTPP